MGRTTRLKTSRSREAHRCASDLRFEAHAETAGCRGERVDCSFGAGGGRARHAEMVLVPEVNPGFVADLHGGCHFAEGSLVRLYDLAFGFPAQVGVVEVEQVVVLDPVGRRPVGEDVPHCLEQTSSCQVPTWEIEGRGATHHYIV